LRQYSNDDVKSRLYHKDELHAYLKISKLLLLLNVNDCTIKLRQRGALNKFFLHHLYDSLISNESEMKCITK